MLSIDPRSGIQPDQVVELDVGYLPSAAGSGELLFHSDDGSTMLVLLVTDRDHQRVGPAIVTFTRCEQSVFGYPNDEAQDGDLRLRQHGYGFLEVLHSPWSDRLTQYNSQAFPDSSAAASRHFVVRCHENLAEFLADDIRVEPMPGNFAAAAREALGRVLQ